MHFCKQDMMRSARTHFAGVMARNEDCNNGATTPIRNLEIVDDVRVWCVVIRDMLATSASKNENRHLPEQWGSQLVLEQYCS
jgi:hypothetical protein